MDEIKQRLKYIRQTNGLTMAEFSARIHVSPGNVGDWESDKRSSTPGTKALIAIAREFNVSLDWLLLGKTTGSATGSPHVALSSPDFHQLALILNKLSASDVELLLQVASRFKSYAGED